MSSHDRPAPLARPCFQIRHFISHLLFCALLIFMAVPVHAQTEDANTKKPTAIAKVDVNVDVVLDKVRAQIDTIQKSLKKPLDDTELAQLRATALDVQAQADAATASIAPQLTSVQARLTELGAPAEGAKEAPDVAAQRAELTKTSSKADAQMKLARLLSVEAGQAAEQILSLRRSNFQARLSERTTSILAPPFWDELSQEWPKDARRLTPIGAELAEAAIATPTGVWIGVLLAIAAVLGLRVLAGRSLIRMTTTLVPPGRLRRSLYAAVLVLLAVAVPGIIAELLRTGISWSYALSDTLDELLARLVGIICFAGFIAGLGNALLAPDRPTWRRTSVPDAMAMKLRTFPVVLAIVIVGGWSAERLAALINASLVATVAVDCFMALALGATMALVLRRGRRLPPDAGSDTEKTIAPPSPIWFTALVTLSWLALAVSLVCILVGYVALGSFIVKQVFWITTVLGSAYLLTVLIDDGCLSLLATVKHNAGDENAARPLTRARSQATVLLSGLGRLMVLLFALMLLLMPFGEGPTELFRGAEQLHTDISIGQVQIRPTAVLLAVLVLVLGFACVRVLKSWLATQYLPTTSLDPGMRVSAASLFGYAGYVLAVALSLSAVGIGLERVTWVASALSVGIGFGLQAVVQNFVSGLILLAERPVKVGDWVSLGGVEGDIRRINVRATEIQMGDRSTVIVPNSEFITKIVRNVTHANPLGLVQIKLPMPMATDAEQVRELMLTAFKEHTSVLDEPAPNVLLDGIDINGLVFNATGYVGSPRAAYGVRSALLFEVLKRIREAGLPLSKPPTMLMTQPAPQSALPAVVAAVPPSTV